MHKLRPVEKHIKLQRACFHVDLNVTKKTGGKKYVESVLDSPGGRAGERHDELISAASR
jgi:hypothetical protein